MPRCPLNQAVRKSSELCRASPRTRAHRRRATSPFADGGTRPHSIITPSDSRSCIRTTGTLWDTATLKRTENCHQGCATESSLSASARSGITNRSLMECERTTDQPIAGNVRAQRQWIPSRGSALSIYFRGTYPGIFPGASRGQQTFGAVGSPAGANQARSAPSSVGNRRDVRVSEVIPFEKQRLTHHLGERVAEAVAKI